MSGILKVLSVFSLLAVGLIVLFEVAAKLVLPDQVAAFRARAIGDDRILFVSPLSYVGQNGYYKFAPDIIYLEAAFYPDKDGELTKEYECTFRSDALGFLFEHNRLSRRFSLAAWGFFCPG